jgi:hypothetical protein
MGTAEVSNGRSVRSNYIKRVADPFDPVHIFARENVMLRCTSLKPQSQKWGTDGEQFDHWLLLVRPLEKRRPIHSQEKNHHFPRHCIQSGITDEDKSALGPSRRGQLCRGLTGSLQKSQRNEAYLWQNGAG